MRSRVDGGRGDEDSVPFDRISIFGVHDDVVVAALEELCGGRQSIKSTVSARIQREGAVKSENGETPYF